MEGASAVPEDSGPNGALSAHDSSGFFLRLIASGVGPVSSRFSKRFGKRAESRGGAVKIHSPLSIEPEAGARSERGPELERHVGGYGSSSVHDAIDHLEVTADVVRELLLCQAKGLEKLFAQNLTRCRRHSSMVHQWNPLVVIDDIDIFGTELGPAKDHTPLVVDPNAVKSSPAPFERLEPVSGRGSQIPKFSCIVEHVELASGDARNPGPPDTFSEPASLKKPSNILAGKTANRHAGEKYTSRRYTWVRYVMLPEECARVSFDG